MLRAALILLLAAAFGGSLYAHTVPVVVIEAEFNSSREAVIKVNLDPRLFLSAQPTSVPPVSASWWFEQDESAQQDSRKAAADYVSRIFSFSVGTTPLQGDWKVEPIDSASAFPLGQASTEAHLLVEHRGALPTSPGDFKVAVGKECAVAVILLCSNTGDAERRPQSLFPGEISRAFPLPAPASQAADATTPTEQTRGDAGKWRARLAWLGMMVGSGHFAADHLAVAVMLGLALSRQWGLALAMLAAFHATNRLAALAVVSGWLPAAPSWMAVTYGVMLALTACHLFVFRSKASSVLLTLAVAGLCHGLNAPHLHLEIGAWATMAVMMEQQNLLLLAELAIFATCVLLLRLSRRRTPPACPAT